MTAAAEIAALDATAQAALVRSGQVSATELVDGAIDRIERLNPQLNAVVTPLFEQARAAVADAAPTGPVRRGALPGQGPRRGDRGHAVARGLDVPARQRVHLRPPSWSRRLRRAGLVILGKTNTPEFGMAPACEPQVHGPTRNPWDPRRSTSGSSGGSAAAVASGMVPMAHGNDLGGSLRYPGVGVRAVRAQADAGAQPARPRVRRRRQRLGRRARADPSRCATAPPCSTPPRAPRPAIPTRRPAARPVRGRGRRRPGTPADRLHRPHPAEAARPSRLRARRSTMPWRCVRRSATTWSKPTCPGSTRASAPRSARCSTPATAWIVALLGAAPRPRARARRAGPADPRLLGRGPRVRPRTTCSPSSDLQKFSRTVATFLGGERVSTSGSPRRCRSRPRGSARSPRPPTSRCARWSGARPRWPTRRRREHHGQPGDVRSAGVERRRHADRHAFPRPVRRRGHAAPAGRPARASPAMGRLDTADPRKPVSPGPAATRRCRSGRSTHPPSRVSR